MRRMRSGTSAERINAQTKKRKTAKSFHQKKNPANSAQPARRPCPHDGKVIPNGMLTTCPCTVAPFRRSDPATLVTSPLTFAFWSRSMRDATPVTSPSTDPLTSRLPATTVTSPLTCPSIFTWPYTQLMSPSCVVPAGTLMSWPTPDSSLSGLWSRTPGGSGRSGTSGGVGAGARRANRFRRGGFRLFGWNGRRQGRGAEENRNRRDRQGSKSHARSLPATRVRMSRPTTKVVKESMPAATAASRTRASG